MLFAMMRLAMLSYHRDGDEPPEFRGKSLDMAGTFRNLVAQCLTLADFTKSYPNLIESLIFHLHGDLCQTREADVSVWVLVGVITRLAMRMGYHRDSKMFPNITPFQGEMRRRVWSFVRQADLLCSSQMGLPNMIRTSDTDTELPRNLYDDDFDENCKELPPSRPPNEPTPISYLIAKSRLTFVFGRVTEITAPLQPPVSYDTVMEVDAQLRRARDLIPEHLLVRPIEDSPREPPTLILSRFTVSLSREVRVWLVLTVCRLQVFTTKRNVFFIENIWSEPMRTLASHIQEGHVSILRWSCCGISRCSTLKLNLWDDYEVDTIGLPRSPRPTISWQRRLFALICIMDNDFRLQAEHPVTRMLGAESDEKRYWLPCSGPREYGRNFRTRR